jgi:putative peptidoglycan lipid II flippase
MLNIPALFGLIVLSVPIVRLIFERGEFGPTDTLAVSAALVAYSPGLLGYSLVKVLAPAFYAMRDARTPVMVSMASVLVNVGLNVGLVRAYGYLGLAVGTAIASLVNAGLLLWLLRQRLGGIDGQRIIWAVLRMSVASCAMAVIAWAAHAGLERVLPGSMLLVQIVRVGLSILAGVAVLVGASRLLRIDEFDEAIGKLVRRLRPARPAGGTGG